MIKNKKIKLDMRNTIKTDIFNRKIKIPLSALLCLTIFVCCFTPVGTVEADSVKLPIAAMPTVASTGMVNMVVKEDGSLWAWGNNASNGVLGLGDDLMRGSYSDRHAQLPPTKVMDDAVGVSLSNNSGALAVKKDGSLWAWGKSVPGPSAYETYQSTPVKVMDDVVFAAAGNASSHAIKSDGSLWTWGVNSYEEFGDDGFLLGSSYLEEPVKVMDDVCSVFAPQNSILALKNDGTLTGMSDSMSSNQGVFGQYIASERIRSASPENPFVVARDVVSMAGSISHTMILKSDGSVWTTGGNSNGILGTGEEESKKRLNFTKIMDDVKYIYFYSSSAAAVKNDGTLWVWGKAPDGNGSSKESNVPVQVPLENVVTAVTDSDLSYALTEDGTLWGWGDLSCGWSDKMMEEANISIEDYVKYSYEIKPKALMTDVALPGSIPFEMPVTAETTSSTVLVDGQEIAFDAYNIGGNNYFKLRDVAKVLSGTEKQFEVAWDDERSAINLLSDKPYTSVGGELAAGEGGSRTALPNGSALYLNGEEISLAAYTINDNNYFKLRDLGEAFDFGVGWDAESQTVTIDTGASYTEA